MIVKMSYFVLDHFGIKFLYYFIHDNKFYFASEIKSLLPFLPSISTDTKGFKDYLTFQLCLGEKTLFEKVKELLLLITSFLMNLKYS